MKPRGRKLNVKFAIGLGVGLIVLATCAHFGHGWQVKRNANIFLEQARQAEKKPDLRKATEYLRRYLGLAPEDTDALALYGTLLADLGDQTQSPRTMQQAYLVFDQVLRRKEARDDIRRREINIAMHPWLQRYNDALEHLGKLIDSAGKDGKLLSLQGRCFEAIGKFQNARNAYEESLTYPGQKRDVYVWLAYLLRHQTDKVIREKATADSKQPKQYETKQEVQARAEMMIEAAVKEYGESFETHLAVAAYYRDHPERLDQDRAEKVRDLVGKHIDKARELAPDEKDVILFHAALEQERNNYDSARAELQRGVTRYPKEFRMYQGLARLEIADKKYDDALAALQKGLNELPEQIDLQWNLAHLLTYQGQHLKASKVVDTLANQGFPQAELDYLRARIHFSKEEWLICIRSAERAYPHLQNRADKQRDWLAINLLQETNFLLAGSYENLGDFDAANAAYNRIVARNPSSRLGLLGAARMEWAVGSKDNAIRQYKFLLQFSNAPEVAWIECAQAIFERNKKPNESDFAETEAVLKKAEKLATVKADVSLLRAQILVAKQQYDNARLLLETNPEDKFARPVEVWIGLANLEQSLGRFARALELLDEAEKLKGDRMEIRIARVRYWVRRGALPETIPALERVGKDLTKFTAQERRRILSFLADGYVKTGFPRHAKDVWRGLADLHHNDLGSRMALVEQAIKEKEIATLGKLIAEIQRIEGDNGAIWRYCQAMQLITRAQVEKDPNLFHEADDLLEDVGKRRPSWRKTRVATAQGHLQDLAKNYRGAIAKYREAVKNGEQNLAVVNRLIELLHALGHLDEADEQEKSLESQGIALELLPRLRTDLALHRGDMDQALALAEKEVPSDSKDYRAHLWLASIRLAVKKPAEAEASLRQAIALAPDVPVTWVSLVKFFSRDKNNRKKAEAVIAEAEKALPKELAPFALAQCHEALGELVRAKELYEQALAAKPNDSMILRSLAFNSLSRQAPAAESMRYFNEILKLKDLPGRESAEARHMVAMILATQRDYQSRRKALEMLAVLDESGSNVQGPSADVTVDQRAKILVLASATNPRQRRQAIALLEDLVRRRRATNDDRFILANLSESLGEWRKAEEHFLYLLSISDGKTDKAGQKKHADLLALYCNGLLKQDAPSKVEPWLAKLESAEPRTLRTVALRARLLDKQKRGQEAVPALVELAAKQENLVGAVARVLEHIGEADQAETMFKKYVASSKKPEARLVLAEFLGRQSRIGDALTLCEAALKDCPVETVAAASVMVLYSGKPSDTECQRVAGWLQEAIDKNPKATAAITQLAAVRRLQKDYSGALALYREVYKENAKDTLLLNNYAWLLALSEGNASEALRIIDQAIESDGPIVELLDTRAVILLSNGKVKEAIENLEEIVTGQPNAERLFHLARAHHQDNNRVAAAGAFQRAVRLGLTETNVDPLELAGYHELRTAYSTKAP